jgi:hypothetical protein
MVARSALLSLLIVMWVYQPAAAAEPAVVLQSQTCRYVIGADGTVNYFGTLDGQHNVCEPGRACMLVSVGGQIVPASKVTRSENLCVVEFAGTDVVARIECEARPDYLALSLVDVQGTGIEWLRLADLRLTITQNVGTLVNAAWDDQFAACVLACNERTHSFGADGATGHLCAQSYADVGLVGARIAVLGLPTHVAEPDRTLLAAIGRVELAEGLPHPLRDGVWIKESPERFRSYLMVHDLGESNVDEILRIARGGFGCIEFYPWGSTPSYEINPALFPHGLAGLQTVCDKIHAAGLQVGLHVMQGMVGWGPKDDPYIVPRADSRLLQNRTGTLATDTDTQATTLTLNGSTADWPERGDLLLDGEVIRYAKRTDTGFAECQRGLHGTTAATHPAGSQVGHLVNCFPIWGGTVYCPNLDSNMPDEICDRLASLFNAVGADMSYFDGGEELLTQPPLWRSVGTFALGLQKRLDKPVFLGGNACYTHLSWHVITRGSPHYDPIHFGRREYTLRFKGTNPAQHAKNLLAGDVGWFAPHVHSLTADAVTPDEVALLCLKALGGKAPISFSVSAANLWKNERMPEMLEIIRVCDELKQRDYFSPSALTALATPRAEYQLEQRTDGEWELRPLQFGPAVTILAADESRAWVYENAYAEQKPFVRLRARSRLAPYGSADNVVLVDPARGNPFQKEATASPDLTHEVELSTETAPDGAAALRYRAKNGGAAPSGWTKIAAKLPAPIDISRHRRMGVWVKANGCGGILNVQLAGVDARRDHYIPLTFTGWKYVELVTGEESRYWEYSWPGTWTDQFYTDWNIFGATNEVDLYFNGLPPGAEADCQVGRIEALRELPGALRNPSLKVGQSEMRFPIELQPDEYVESDFAGRCRHYSPNGKVLAEVTPIGELKLPSGSNTLQMSCATEGECTTRAEVTVSVRGEPLSDARRAPPAGEGE